MNRARGLQLRDPRETISIYSINDARNDAMKATHAPERDGRSAAAAAAAFSHRS